MTPLGMSCNINVVAFFLKGGDGRAEQGDQEQQLFQRMERFKKKKPVGCCNRFDDKSAWTKRWTEERLVDEEEVYRGFRRMPPGWSDDSRKSSLKTKG
ncbi:hypothetical protein [Geobacillus zalihae]|uniref:hypothetical protein n=1 Tax=Geobacillus zalihae TaxID=213419 RepID=UPI0016814F40|nr:hypothetical protein [Geobacillus zalihae]QNU23795.1 hypothetical protein IC806_11825 [Geobacillus zalihae]